MEHWWNGIDREKLKYLDLNLFHCHFVESIKLQAHREVLRYR